MSIKSDFDHKNEIELLDRIDGLVLPYYNHIKYNEPYPPLDYDHSKPRVKYIGMDGYLKKTREYILTRKKSIITFTSS